MQASINSKIKPWVAQRLLCTITDLICLCSESSQGPGGTSTPSLSPNGGRSGRVEDSETTAVMLMAFAIKFAFKVHCLYLTHLHPHTDSLDNVNSGRPRACLLLCKEQGAVATVVTMYGGCMERSGA